MFHLYVVDVGGRGDTVHLRAGLVLYSDSLCDDEFSVDGSKVLMVLLHLLLLFHVLHILRHDDSLHLPEPSSGCHLCRNLLFALQSLLGLFHSKTSKLLLLYNETTIFTSSQTK